MATLATHIQETITESEMANGKAFMISNLVREAIENLAKQHTIKKRISINIFVNVACDNEINSDPNPVIPNNLFLPSKVNENNLLNLPLIINIKEETNTEEYEDQKAKSCESKNKHDQKMEVGECKSNNACNDTLYMSKNQKRKHLKLMRQEAQAEKDKLENQERLKKLKAISAKYEHDLKMSNSRNRDDQAKKIIHGVNINQKPVVLPKFVTSAAKFDPFMSRLFDQTHKHPK